MTASYTTTDHPMTRLDISTGIPFDEFRAAFEHAAPVADLAAVQRIIAGGGNWDDVRAAAAANAPHELMIYWTIDAAPLFAVAGHRTRAVEYLVGNHVIAETMFGHDAKALLYAPLRLMIYADAAGNAVFSMDQPSKAFASLGIDAVTEVGNSLDRKVAELLRVIGVIAGAAFH